MSSPDPKAKKSGKWFYRVRTEEQALRAIRISALGMIILGSFYTLEGLVFSIFPFLVNFELTELFNPVSLGLVIAGILGIVAGYYIKYSRSRFVAWLFGLYFVANLIDSAYFTFTSDPNLAQLGYVKFSFLDLILQPITAYVAYYAIRGTSVFHSIQGTRMVWKGVFLNCVLYMSYLILTLLVLSQIIDRLVKLDVPEIIEGTIKGLIVLGLTVLLAVLVCFQKLPFTKRKLSFLPSDSTSAQKRPDKDERRSDKKQAWGTILLPTGAITLGAYLAGAEPLTVIFVAIISFSALKKKF